MSFGLRHCGGIGGAGLVCVTAAKRENWHRVTGNVKIILTVTDVASLQLKQLEKFSRRTDHPILASCVRRADVNEGKAQATSL